MKRFLILYCIILCMSISYSQNNIPPIPVELRFTESNCQLQLNAPKNTNCPNSSPDFNNAYFYTPDNNSSIKIIRLNFANHTFLR